MKSQNACGENACGKAQAQITGVKMCILGFVVLGCYDQKSKAVFL